MTGPSRPPAVGPRTPPEEHSQQDQPHPQGPRDAEPFVQEYISGKSRSKGAQGGEQSCTFGGRAALRHRLERESEIAAHHSQSEDDTPLGSRCRHSGDLEKESHDYAVQPYEPYLQDAERKGIVPSAEAIGEDDGTGIKGRRGQTQRFPLRDEEGSPSG